MKTPVPPPPAGERILFQNEACAVINKLPGESSEFPETGFGGSGGEGAVFPVHRLDQPVSGCLLLARTPEAAAFPGAAFAGQGKKKLPGKIYWAIVEKPQSETRPASAETPPAETPPFPGQGELVHWLYEDRKANKSFALPWQENQPLPHERRGGRRPKKAALRYRLVGRGDNYLFLEINLATGRHHQIRAQLAAAGLRVKGDLKYGAKRSEKGGGIRLHAYSLAFPNPLNPGETILVEALPQAMDPLWTAFARAAGKSSD